MKTMAIRLDDDVAAQLAVLAQLDGVSIADEIRQAIELLIAHKRSQPELASRAEQVVADIDQDASARKSAIQTLFGATGEAPGTSPPKGGRSRRPARPGEAE